MGSDYKLHDPCSIHGYIPTIGIAVQSEKSGLVLSLTTWCKMWQNNHEVIDQEFDELSALQITSGKDISENSYSIPARACSNYPIGDLTWYLPSLQEAALIVLLRDEINAVISAISTHDSFLIPETGFLWTCCEHNAVSAWAIAIEEKLIVPRFKEQEQKFKAVASFHGYNEEIVEALKPFI